MPEEPQNQLAGTPSPYNGGDMPMAATVAAPMRELPSAMMLQNEANDRLSKAVEILHDRTSGLRSPHVEKEPENRAMRDFGSDTARGIADQAHRTMLAAQVIEKILTEMEI